MRIPSGAGTTQRRKGGMNYSKYQQQLGDTTACIKIMMEATKLIGQKYRKGVTKDFLFLVVSSPQRIWQKLRWNLVPNLLVWFRQIPKDSVRRLFRILQRISQEVLTSC